MTEKKYTIGEAAEMLGINAKTLRYYDSIGLLSPGERNPETGYRYYTKAQLLDLALIRRLRNLDFSLKDIGRLLDTDSVDVYSAAIGGMLENTRNKIAALESKCRAGEALLRNLRIKEDLLKADTGDAGAEQPSGTCIEHIGETRVLYTSKKMKDYNNIEISIDRWSEVLNKAAKRDINASGPIILTYHTEHPLDQLFKSSCDLEVMLPVDESCKGKEVRVFGGFDAAVTYHFGAYDDISVTYMKLMRWIDSSGYVVYGDISEEYLISPIDITAKNEYITKLIVPVRKKARK